MLGTIFANDIKKAMKKYKSYTILTTPISHEKKEERGFNQVSTILDYADIKYKNLFKKEDSLAQSKKTREERYLIFDDIYTTGKTIELMKRLLLEKGVKEIKTFSIAR